ncbi:hypothetical protein [Pedobacter sp. Hv1]|uniref:hypothetical protein n=1 Tax=Pedobacter sp. Hv1 TaxID=1740090 RepID=UPI0006D8AF1C|nr:hypothetical protein [Pedobacter sp. Hv1]KQC00995.1 PKD domain-containing protein [Pedobacter sp. Hv1]
MKIIFKIRLLLLMLLVVLVYSCKKSKEAEPEVKQSPYISKIFEYKPAPGQFINDPSYGTLDKAKSLIGTVDNGLLSLGGFGGYVIFGFDHAIQNGSGHDLGIFGNPLIGVGMEWAEPGIVCVMQDVNKNGLPDDGEWLELAGSEYASSETIKNYKITYYKPTGGDDIKWTDNKGGTGYILKNGFHLQDWYPLGYAGNEVSFEGTLLKNTLKDGGIITNQPFAFGYTDSGSSEYLKLQNELGRGYNTFDIDWAVNKNGQKVALTAIDFVKVYTGQNCNGNPYHPITDNARSRYLGEISTEIAGAIDIKLYQQQKK